MAKGKDAALNREGKVLDQRPGPLGQLMSRPLFWGVLILVLVLAPIAGALARQMPEQPGVFGTLPSFELTNEKKQPFGSEQLRGKIWVANFVFTSCPSVCPKLMERMQEVQHRSRNAGAGFQLVTITVDPENDTPEKLREYAYRFAASPYRWNFLTGDLKAIEKTVIDGFKLAMGKDADNLFEIFHSERLVLVDRKGRIRGYFEANDEGIDKLMRTSSVLMNLE